MVSPSPSGTCCGNGEGVESEEKNMETQRMCVWDDDDDHHHHYHHHINAFQYTAEKADSFVIDMDAFSSAINKDPTNTNASPNSRITLQRSHSRKGSQRGGDRKLNGNATVHDKDTVSTTCSPKGGVVGTCTPEKGAVIGSTDHSMNPQIHHQISITGTGTTADSSTKSMVRRNSFRRTPSWTLDPKRVLLFFATLSSIGTMLLIYFTLRISKENADEFGG